jgi:hypothetical protein
MDIAVVIIRESKHVMSLTFYAILNFNVSISITNFRKKHLEKTSIFFIFVPEQASVPRGRRGLGSDVRDEPHHRHELPQLRLHGLV